jgi:hypothetical protein
MSGPVGALAVPWRSWPRVGTPAAFPLAATLAGAGRTEGDGGRAAAEEAVAGHCDGGAAQLESAAPSRPFAGAL